MAEERRQLEAGTTLAHYRVEACVGQGAMGVVYRARDTSLERDVALKVLRSEVSNDETFVRRFVREARAAARVAHRNLAHIYFIGEQDGTHFFAMEYIDGRDLDEVVRQDGPLDLEAALDVLVQAARGLAAAHRAGVVHRDVKPSNILLQPDGTVRITDFGLAKSYDLDLDATQPGQILGTPRFMSPEQCRGETADARSDIYALGLAAWYVLAGRDPFGTPSLGALINDQINTPLPRLAEENENFPEELDDVLQAMCAKKSEDRLQDMETVIQRLEACRPHAVPPAPLATRALAAFFDFVLVSLVWALIAAGFGVFLDLDYGLEHPLGNLGLTLFFVAYHLISDARWGQTLGKRIFGIQARAGSGMRLPRRVLLPRLLIRYPSVLVFPVTMFYVNLWVSIVANGIGLAAILGGVVVYFIRDGRTLSDVLTRTCVTYRIPQGSSSATK